ncbi:OmpA family protein [uncultured Alistipes sp.]|jgi:hypothetical protein|uniref:OmpA family protein n=1 Tax=uncultured Alistipes sp. TaxID=538949 RepID=UPI0027D96F92|nr:OmpA family protein [uncultured Alistipes sp.]
MKKIILIIYALAISIITANAQVDKYAVETADIKLIRTGEDVTVTFTVDAGKRVAKRGYTLVVDPVISNGANAKQLPAIVIRGRTARVNTLRHELATGAKTHRQAPVYVSAGKKVNYKTTIPYETWMHGAQLILNGVSVGCCSSQQTSIGLIADNILQGESTTEIQIVEVPVSAPTASVGDQLAAQYSFIAPVTEFEEARKTPTGLFDYNMPLNLGKGLTTPEQNEVERFINDTREGSISIYFRQGRRNIDRNYMGNNKLLVELISAVRALTASQDSRVVRIVIAGFASPEGTAATNDRLAWERAVAVKSFLTANSGVNPDVIQIYNGSVDWIGLRAQVVASDMYQKYSIIDVIDNTPVWDSYRKVGRHGELMRLDGGTPYRYMVREFFPKLRQAAYIKVYYENQ